MSIPRQMTVNCSKCGKPLTATVFESINTNYGESVANQIISGELFNVECPHCQFISHLEYDFLYHDLHHGAMVWVVHRTSPEYTSRIAEIRNIKSPPYKTLRIVEDINALKEKVSCLESGRDDRVVELCKVFTAVNLLSQHPDFVLRNVFYTAIDGKERLYFYDPDRNHQCCDLPQKVYDYLSELYFNSAYATQFDGNYAIVDYAWAKSILFSLIDTVSAVPPETTEHEDGKNNNSEQLICPYCDSELPGDSEFCQYCGKKIDDFKVAPVIAPVSTPTNIEKATSVKPNTSTTSNRSNAPASKLPEKWRIGIAIVLVLAILSVALNMYQYFSYQNNSATIVEQLNEANNTISSQKSEIDALEKEVSSQKRKINLQEQTITSQENNISSLDKKSKLYDSIVSGMKSGNAGYAASNFFASDSVIIVGKNETNRKFKLTANWSNGGSVYVDYSSNAAWVSFDKSEWSTSTQMTVHPKSEGVTIVTFSNSVDSRTFKVLIIVTG